MLLRQRERGRPRPQSVRGTLQFLNAVTVWRLALKRARAPALPVLAYPFLP
jgi:hypothetical protein